MLFVFLLLHVYSYCTIFCNSKIGIIIAATIVATMPPIINNISGSNILTNASTVFSKVVSRSEEHTSELQSRPHLVCRLLLEKKKKKIISKKDKIVKNIVHKLENSFINKQK